MLHLVSLSWPQIVSSGRNDELIVMIGTRTATRGQNQLMVYGSTFSTPSSTRTVFSEAANTIGSGGRSSPSTHGSVVFLFVEPNFCCVRTTIPTRLSFAVFGPRKTKKLIVACGRTISELLHSLSPVASSSHCHFLRCGCRDSRHVCASESSS